MVPRLKRLWRMTVTSKKPWVVAQYRMAQWKNRAYQKSPKVLNIYTTLSSVKRVAFIHSFRHFHPAEDNPKREFYYSSTGSIARNIWKLLEGKERIHIDIKKKIKDVPKVDLVIGLLSENFIACAKANPQARKILLLVNCHPLYRARVLIEESKKLKKPIPPGEWIDPGLLLRARAHIDAIALIGNENTKDTYLAEGLVEIPIFTLNLGINREVLEPKPEFRPKTKIRFLYPASDMGIRKGFFRMMEAWEKLNAMVSPDAIELYLTGMPSFPRDMTDFLSRHRNVKYLGWGTYLDEVKLMQSSHCVLGPTLEEGQVGWILEAMSTGAVPIVTPQCGITLRDKIEGFLIKDMTCSDEIALYMKEVVENLSLRNDMSRAIIDQVTYHHTWEKFRNDFKDIIEKKRRYLTIALPMHEMQGFDFFLRRNLELLCKQTFQDFDVVVSDNSSGDNIKKIYKEYMHRLDIHHYRNTKPRTLAFNANNAIRRSTGKLIKILFVDDYFYHDDALKDIVETFDLAKDQWLVTACEHTRDGQNFYMPFYPRYHDKIYLGDNTISSPSVLTIKNENPLLFDTRMTWLVDCDYYKRLYDKFGKPKILNKINVVNTVGAHQTTVVTANKKVRASEYRLVLKKYNEKKLLRDYDAKHHNVRLRFKKYLREKRFIIVLRAFLKSLF